MSGSGAGLGAGPEGLLLAIDTSTAEAVVALGRRSDGRVVDASRWRAGFRHGEELLPQIEALLARQHVDRATIDAIVVGTGPGAFTGLRVGLATAKGLAHGLRRPIVGIGSAEALLDAARAAGQSDPLALVLPAGPTDRVVVETGSDGRATAPRRIGPERSPAGPAVTVIAVDLDGRAAATELARGEAVRSGLGEALVRLAAIRLAAGAVDDLASLVPIYVTAPRGVVVEVDPAAVSLSSA